MQNLSETASVTEKVQHEPQNSCILILLMHSGRSCRQSMDSGREELIGVSGVEGALEEGRYCFFFAPLKDISFGPVLNIFELSKEPVQSFVFEEISEMSSELRYPFVREISVSSASNRMLLLFSIFLFW